MFTCPKCKNQGDFKIDGYAEMTVYVDAEGNSFDSKTGNIYWKPDDEMICLECRQQGIVKDFCQEGVRLCIT